ncbi:MAG TPA: endonuclease NucS [Acidimicrobiales bacterium]|nr:endonuclease NucS [Acidimicrobiales bacterium]
MVDRVRLVIGRCSVEYSGRLDARLPEAVRLVMVKADGSVSIHSDDRAYKPLNWMSPPAYLIEEGMVWTVTGKGGDRLVITFTELLSDSLVELGAEPGLVKDGVEADLQELLAADCSVIEDGLVLVRREYPTAIGPVDLLCRDRHGATVAVEIKRRGEIDGVEQLTRYLDQLRLDRRLGQVRGVLAAQEIRPQAKVLAAGRDIACVEVDYARLKGTEVGPPTLF